MEIRFPTVLHKRRSDEGKRIRRLYKHDAGVPYQAVKAYNIDNRGICDTITTFTTDNNIIEMTDNIQKGLTYKEHPSKEDLLEYFSRRIRIRKMTPTEAFRLMDVSDADIEKIQAYPFKTYKAREEALAEADKKEAARIKRESIAKTNQYKLAGNSIVISCLYHIFRTMFVPGQPENDNTKPLQLTLF